MSELLTAEDLVAGYVPEVDVVRGCSITLGRGELVGIIGPNGAGKSTLMKALFGLVPVRDGRVLLRDADVTGLPAHRIVRLGVGYVPQNDNVFPSLTVDENLQMGCYLRPRTYARRRAALTEMFPLLGKRRTTRCGSLSGGERQIVAMARALMTEPDVLFLDEPSSGLSPIMQDTVFESVQHINEAGVSVLMVEQNARRCLQICTRGYVLDQGREAHTGTGQELLDDERVVELYLGTLARVE